MSDSVSSSSPKTSKIPLVTAGMAAIGGIFMLYWPVGINQSGDQWRLDGYTSSLKQK